MIPYEEKDNLKRIDQSYIWHPFTQMKEWMESEPTIIVEGKDCFIKDINGRWYLDGVSSIWVNLFGHRRKEIDDAIKSQLDMIAHSTLLGLGNLPSILLAERLLKVLPVGLTKIFYSDNGSTSVEVAIKMVFQYWIHMEEKKRVKFVSLKNAYHGDTLGAVSVGGIDIFHSVFGPLLFQTIKVPSPYCYRCEFDLQYPHCGFMCLEKTEEVVKAHKDEIAGFIIEPLVQAAGGIIVSPTGYLKGVSDICRRYGIPLIVDEVATGFGRTGKMFAVEHEDVIPDVMCLSKGITGGYLPLAVTVTKEEIFNAFLGRFEDLKTFFHGHSYTGNQLACSAAIKVLEIFEKDDVLNQLKPKIEFFKEKLFKMKVLRHVGDVRTIGLIGGVELVRNKDTKEPYEYREKMGWKVSYIAREKGVFIRPLGNVVVLWPPLSISIENLEVFLDIIEDSIKTATEG